MYLKETQLWSILMMSLLIMLLCIKLVKFWNWTLGQLLLPLDILRPILEIKKYHIRIYLIWLAVGDDCGILNQMAGSHICQVVTRYNIIRSKRQSEQRAVSETEVCRPRL